MELPESGDNLDGIKIIYPTSQYRGGTEDAPVLFELPKPKGISHAREPFQDWLDRLRRQLEKMFSFKDPFRITAEKDFEDRWHWEPFSHPKIGNISYGTESGFIPSQVSLIFHSS